MPEINNSQVLLLKKKIKKSESPQDAEIGFLAVEVAIL